MKKTAFVLSFVAVVVLIVLACGIAMVSSRRELSGYPKIMTSNADCASLSGSSTGTYDATVIAKKNMNDAADAVNALVQKYQGDITSSDSSSESYETGPNPSDSVTIPTVTINATIPFQNTDAFMKDMQSNVDAGNDTLADVSYDKTDGAQTAQTCLSDENYIRINEANVQIYLSKVPFVIEHDTVSTTTDTSNLQDINSQLENFYSEIESYSSDISSLFESANQLSVSVTIQDRETPPSYYPPDSSNSDAGSVPPSGQ